LWVHSNNGEPRRKHHKDRSSNQQQLAISLI
jgi:hypothetical protein